MQLTLLCSACVQNIESLALNSMENIVRKKVEELMFCPLDDILII